MPKIVFCAILMILSGAVMAQNEEVYVKLTGTALNQKDSAEIQAIVMYEKLPYYDDMGMGSTSAGRPLEFYLLDGLTYIFTIKKEDFLDYQKEITISHSGDKVMSYQFYLEPEAEPDLITLDDLIFARGSDRITESSYEELDDLVEYLEGRPSMIIQLEGHTDFAGNEDANMRLSQARVEAVKDYLIKKGVRKNRVLTKAFGGTQPLFTERTDEAKTKNRRVEVRVISR